MKFLVDAQMPRSLVKRLNEQGHAAIHTLDLPLGNSTPDALMPCHGLARAGLVPTCAPAIHH